MAGESKFVRERVRPDLESRFPGGKLIKQEPLVSFQGIPDYLFLYQEHWAALETKAKPNSRREPNQEYYVEQMSGMSFAAFANPDNWQEVLSGMEEAFGVGK